MTHLRSLFHASSPSRDPVSERPRFLSEADCRDLVQRLAHVAQGGGYTKVILASTWMGNVRWARNQISTAGEVCDNIIFVERNLNGARGEVRINETTDAALVAAARQAERLAAMNQENSQSDLVARLPLESHETPQLFSEATYQLDAERRAEAAISLAHSAAAAGMLSAGYIEVIARSMATLDTLGRVLYFPYTHAQYSVTVRDPKGTGSGWAGDDHYDWTKIDANKLTALALDKCLKSQNPVKVEPGRYTVILEPQAVGDFVGSLIAPPSELGLNNSTMDMDTNLYPSTGGIGPFNKSLEGPHYTLLGEQVVDPRITISSDPMDPELSFPPFDLLRRNGFDSPVYHKVTWIDRGVLTHLSYDRDYAIDTLGRNMGLPNSGSFRMTGGDTTMEEMIATTKRGLLVTRFDQLQQLDLSSQLYRGYTRDGLWLIENGKISKPVKNLVFTESILFALNNVEQLGVSQRVFHPGLSALYTIPQPVMVPPIKIREFSFTAMTDAI